MLSTFIPRLLRRFLHTTCQNGIGMPFRRSATCWLSRGGIMPTAVQRRLPVGAEPGPDGTHFRVWAPRRSQIEVVLDRFRTLELERERDGYFSGFGDSAQPGML